MYAMLKITWKTIDNAEIEFEQEMLVHEIKFGEPIIELYRFGEVVGKIDTRILTELHVVIA